MEVDRHLVVEVRVQQLDGRSNARHKITRSQIALSRTRCEPANQADRYHSTETNIGLKLFWIVASGSKIATPSDRVRHMKVFKAIAVTVTTVFGFCALMPHSIAAKAEVTLKIKDLAIGEPTTPGAVESAFGVTCGAGLRGMQVCNGVGRIAQAVAQYNIVIGADGVLDRVRAEISASDYDAVSTAVRKQFGAPASSRRPVVQNGFGAKFRDEELSWNGISGSQLVLNRFTSDLEHSLVIFSTRRDRDLTNATRPNGL